MGRGVGQAGNRSRSPSPGWHWSAEAEYLRPHACAAASAFTLVEVIITLGLLVLLAGLAWPALQTQITAAELPESADRMRSVLFMARCEAMMQHRRFRIRFAPDEQHPAIEYESDPVNQPGVFVQTTTDWADERVLIGNVQVHEVRPGRPVYLQALSTTSDPDSMLKLAEEAERQRVDRESLNQGAGIGARRDEEIDPQRPVIVFEPDGSTDWATLVLARVLPSEPLEEDEPQVWIVIDGRTGLVTIRDKVTQEQLSDPKFYVEREKLELPESESLSFEIGGDLAGGGGVGGGERSLSTGGTGTEASMDTTAAIEAVGAVGQGSSERSQGRSTAGTPRLDAETAVDQAVQESDLTEEERDNVRRSFPRRNR